MDRVVYGFTGNRKIARWKGENKKEIQIEYFSIIHFQIII